MNIYWKAAPDGATEAEPQIVLDVIDVLSESETDNTQAGGSKDVGLDKYILSEKEKKVDDKIIRNKKLKKSYDDIEKIIKKSNNKEQTVKELLNSFKIIKNTNKK